MVRNDEYYDLGTYARHVTGNAKAQLWFNRGLIWCYGFNHEEAVTCFERAIKEDSSCAMGHWGIAYALGPNYNKPWESLDDHERQYVAKRTHRAVKDAQDALPAGFSAEHALIQALQYRYPATRVHGEQEWSIWNREYADAMMHAYENFPDDLDVAALYVDAMMNLTPWQMWDIRTGKPSPKARTLQVKAALERAFTLPGGLEHPGLLHLNIHFVEMGPSPEAGLPLADRLRGLVPDSGHLNHMPTHLDIICGDYRRAVASNSEAVIADEKFAARAGPLNFYTLYRAHDYHFKLYAAMFAGQSKVALDTAIQLEKALPEELLRRESPPMADWLEGFSAMRPHALIRFGRWQEIVDLELPVDQTFFCVNTAMMRYAKVIALAALGRFEEACQTRTAFDKAYADIPESRTLFNNTCVDLLKIAQAMLNGELEYRMGNIEKGMEWLRKSIELDDNLPYDEPWGWMQPTRHAYGALLLEQGRVEEAAAVYRADLGFDNTLPRALRHLNNVWSLHGYHECLVKLGKHSEASLLKPQLDLALAVADVPIKSSCFCRLNTANTNISRQGTPLQTANL